MIIIIITMIIIIMRNYSPMRNSKFCGDTDILKGYMEWKEGTSMDAEWFKDVKNELEQDEGQDKTDITKDKMMRVMRKMPNW